MNFLSLPLLLQEPNLLGAERKQDAETETAFNP